MKLRHTPPQARSQSGLGAIAAIVILVLLSSIAASVTRMSWTQQVSFGQDVMAARAFQAANAGTEWGMYQALQGGWQDGSCNGASTTMDLRTDMGFLVTVTCTSHATVFNEGQDASGTADATVRIYVIDAYACNGSAATCPDAASSARSTYVERHRQAIVTKGDNGF
jgi:MSHA biogenesis protein MshP